MKNFNEFIEVLKKQLADIAKDATEDIREELLADGQSFAQTFRNDLQRWGELLAQEKLTREEFEYLLQAKKDLAVMEALKQKGLAQARIDELKNAVIGAVVGSALKIVR